MSGKTDVTALRRALFDAVCKLEEASGFVSAGQTDRDKRYVAELQRAARAGREALGR